MLLLPLSVNAQGSGKSSTGTDGNHIIQGYVFFPSGRRADGTIVVKLQSISSSVNCRWFPIRAEPSPFLRLSPGNYTVVVNASDEYEIAREGVYIDTDLNLSRTGSAFPPPHEGTQ